MQDEIKSEKGYEVGIEYSLGKLQETVKVLAAARESNTATEAEKETADKKLQALALILGIVIITEPTKFETLADGVFVVHERIQGVYSWENYKR